MKKVSYILLAMLFVFGSVVMCEAIPLTSIFTSATGNQFEEGGVNIPDNFSYTFEITKTNGLIYHATLTNTSTIMTVVSPLMDDPLIDAFAFNILANMDDDFFITNIDPSDWTIAVPTGGAITFDYVGNEVPNQPDDRLGAGDTLDFDFEFDGTFEFPDEPFDIWLTTDESGGGGFGGGDPSISGQVAVSFQQLGDDGEGSALLASNWEGGADSQYVIPEPATMLLLGSGLIGFAVRGKKRLKKRNG